MCSEISFKITTISPWCHWAEIPKSPCLASYTHQNSKGTHQLTTCVLGTYKKFSMNKNINDGTHSQSSRTHMDHGPWFPRTHKEVLVNNSESLNEIYLDRQMDIKVLWSMVNVIYITSGWETKNFWHSPELGSLLYSRYKIPLAQACFPLAWPNFHSHWRAGER